MRRKVMLLMVAVAALIQPHATWSAEPANNHPGVVAEFVAESFNLHSPGTPPLSLDHSQPGTHLQSLGSAAVQARDKLAEIQAWNLGQSTAGMQSYDQRLTPSRRAFRNGFLRRFTQPTAVNLEHNGVNVDRASFDPVPSAAAVVGQRKSGSKTWVGSYFVEQSQRLRLRLENADISIGTRMWVQGGKNELIGPFGTELVDANGVMYTPSVTGPVITLLVESPAGTAHAQFSVNGVAELFALGGNGVPLTRAQDEEDDTSCLEEVSCHGNGTFSFIDEAKSAVGLIYFMEGSDGYICTGGLINDEDVDTVKNYFLTANHCISSNAVANTVEVVWDYYASSCGSSPPSQGSRPRSSGASLLVTDANTDFTLLELNNRPDNRWFLGWDSRTAAISQGTLLHRLSHPAGKPQHLSQATVDTNANFQCQGVPRPDYIYTQLTLGGTQGGSSGSPLLTGNGQIVGQLYGACGEDFEATCDYNNRELDGSLAAYWSKISPFLTATSEPPPEPEPPEPTAADLAVMEFDVVGNSHVAGSDIQVDNRIENLGEEASNTYTLRFYASTNTSITGSDRYLGEVNRAALAGGAIHQYTTTVTIPANLAPGDYYIGARMAVIDASSDNNVAYDATRITVLAPEVENVFPISPGVGGVWGDASVLGQGMMMEVFPVSGLVFVAWFTFDTSQPRDPGEAELGFSGHRWLTGVGQYEGSTATINLQLTDGGLFNQASPPVSQKNGYGTLEIEFFSCEAAEARFDLPAINQQGTIDLQRFTQDSIDTCEAETAAYE